MTGSKRKADRYISPGGRPPDYDESGVSRDLMCIASFLFWIDPRDMFGGYTARQATDAFFRLTDFDQAKIRKILDAP